MPFKHFIFAVSIVALTAGCQSKQVKKEEATVTPPVVATSEEKAKTAETSTSTETSIKENSVAKTEAAPDDLQIKLIDKKTKKDAHGKLIAETAAVAEKTEAIANQHEKILGARKPGPVPADKALSWLKNGNRRFTKGFFRADGAAAKDRKRLVAGQKPHATVFTCSDSRVPPEIVLDQKLGEIYSVRVSGKVLNANTISSIEYAVQYLGTNLVLLLGHDNCNVSDEGVKDAILADSKIIRDAIATGNVKIVSALYHLDTGAIDWK